MTENPKPTAGEMALMNIGNLGADLPAQMQEFLTALNQRKVMEGVINDIRQGKGYHSAPSSTLPAEPSRPAPPTKSVNGWLPETKTESPPGMDHIERLANTFQPHGPMNPVNPLKEVAEKFVAQGKEEKGKGKSES